MTRRSEGVVWDASDLSREARWASTGMSGATVWLTGLPAAGKSTVAVALERRLVEAGRPAYRLDGDNLRHGINGDLGFDTASRDENVRRTGELARLMADAGLIAIVAIVSPYAAARDAARAAHERDGLAFLEVWVNTPLAICEDRDPKGLYAKARRGDLHGMTGVDDPYEQPVSPDVELHSRDEGVQTEVQRLLDALRARAVIL